MGTDPARNRPSIAVSRALLNYAAGRAKDGFVRPRSSSFIGGKIPPVDQLATPGKAAGRMPDASPVENDPGLTELLRAVIRRDASPEQVARAGEAVEAYVVAHPKAKDQLGQIARRVVGSGKLETYGTPPARKLLTNWEERFGPKPAETKEKGAEPK